MIKITEQTHAIEYATPAGFIPFITGVSFTLVVFGKAILTRYRACNGGQNSWKLGAV